MPIARIGYGTDFILKNQGVGIGTDTTDVKLEVGGTTKANYNITGIASLANYAGFANAEQNIAGVTTVTGEHSTLGDIVVGVGSVLHVSTGATVCTGSVESISITGHFAPPCGAIEDRQECPVEGTVRFNKDLNTLEFYNGVDWRQFTVSGQRGRGVFAGGKRGGVADGIFFIEIMTKGNFLDFGTNGAGNLCVGTSNGTRGVYNGGNPQTNTMEYITIASSGDAIDFGDLTQARGYAGGASSSTRGLVVGGYFTPNYTNIIDYHQISTLGNAIDFGDTRLIGTTYGTTGSPIQAVFTNGNITNAFLDTVKYSTLGNSTGFGDLTVARRAPSAAGNAVRGIFSGGYNTPVNVYKTIDYITFSSTGNATDFGDRTFSGSYSASTSNSVRVVNAGGFHAPTNSKVIEYITIATTGNAQDFGDTSETGNAMGATSDSHGGLGGY